MNFETKTYINKNFSFKYSDAEKSKEEKNCTGNKEYELTNHLGNVLTVISDRKIGIDDDNDGKYDYYVADVISSQDYLPFG
ncbi:MAG: hypothetical protein Q8880_13385, partial [Bacteroidota bacterium]|nr:hypothetical protein [Bacteroidota bacterium]